jgi:AcrR family transcriptional regulator
MSRSDRRGQALAAARRLIAAHGMAGFTLRTVARDAGIHHATLLHYFPSKAALLHALVDSLLVELRTPHSEVPSPSLGSGALGAIRHEFHDILYRLRQDMSLFVVMGELQLHARHEPEVRAQLERLDGAWSGYLAHLLRRGVEDGELRADLDVAATCLALMVQFKGITLQAAAGADLGDLERAAAVIASQLDSWLLA